MKKKIIVVTGGSGRFGKVLKKTNNQNKLPFSLQKSIRHFR